MTVCRIALDRPTQSRGEVWRQTLRWRSGGGAHRPCGVCVLDTVSVGATARRAALTVSPRVLKRRLNTDRDGGAEPSHAPQVQHRYLGGLQIAPPSCRRRAAKGEPGTGAKRSGTVRFEHGCDRVGPRGGVSRSVEPVARRPGPGGRNASARTMHGSGRPVAQAADQERTGAEYRIPPGQVFMIRPAAGPPSPLPPTLRANRRLQTQPRATPVR